MSEVKSEPKTPKTPKAGGGDESALQGAGPSGSAGKGQRGGGFTPRGGRGGAGGGDRGGRGGGGAGDRGGRGGGRGGFSNQRGGGQGNQGGGPGGDGAGRGNFRGGRGGGGRGGGGDRDGSVGRGGHGGGQNRWSGGNFDRIMDRLSQIAGQSTVDLPQLDMTEKKFNGRSRLYVGNMTNDMTEEQLKEIMAQYGEVGEVFYNKDKNFAFLRMGSRLEAEKAKRELDGQMRNGRALKVRFAPHQGAVKVSNLGPWVSNELLHKCFAIFGDIERCLVFVDDRGRSKGEGVVEFERKPSALEAVKRCTEGSFFLTASLRPVIVEPVEENDDDDGMQEKMLPKRNQEYHLERETGPRFASASSFEFEYGSKWKALYEMKKQKLEALDREMKLEEDKLVAQMEYARYEHETEHLREQLRQREANRDQQKSAWEMKERQMEDMIKREQDRRVQEEQDLMSRMQQTDTNMRQKQQDNSLFMQAQELNQMLDRAEGAMNNSGGRGGGSQGGFGGNQGGGGGNRGFQSNGARGGGGGGGSRFNDNGNQGFGGGNQGFGGQQGFGDQVGFGNQGGFGEQGGFGQPGNQGGDPWLQNDGPGGKRRRY